MTEEYRRFRDEEKLARKFFQPIEQELFRYSVMVEQEEVAFAFGLLSGKLKNELFRFWGLPEGLPEKCAGKLEQILPWAKMIKGDIEQTARALEIILDKPVRFEAVSVDMCEVPVTSGDKQFGELGIDSVVGSCFWEPSLCWKFYIDKIEKEDIEDYRPVGAHGKLLKHFEEIFIPLEIDIIFEYGVLPSKIDGTDEILGYSLVLQN